MLGTAELGNAMDRYVRTVLDRASELSIGDLRAVTRLLQFGATHATIALERAQQPSPEPRSPRPPCAWSRRWQSSGRDH